LVKILQIKNQLQLYVNTKEKFHRFQWYSRS